MPFQFLKLDVYKWADQFVSQASTFTKQWGGPHAELADQLTRASLSIPTNIAEGYGRWHSKDKAQFYRFALGSTTECASLLTTAHTLRLLPAEKYEELITLLDRIAQMTQKLVHAVTTRKV